MSGKIWWPRDGRFLKNGKCGAGIKNCVQPPDIIFRKGLQNWAPLLNKNIWRIRKTIASTWGKNMFGYLSLDIICSSKLTVFLEVRSRKTVRISEQIMSADKYPSIFSRQMEAIVYIFLVSNDVCCVYYWVYYEVHTTGRLTGKTF